ncbi:MAG: pyrroline-5-carboxylate reductase [Dysgonomonas sp.]
MNKKITIIGGGNMGGAIAKGLATGGMFSPKDITVIDQSDSKVQEFKSFNKDINAVVNDYSSISEADVVIIAVKPWIVQEIITDKINSQTKSGQIIISIAALTSLSQLDEWTGHKNKALFRVVPNTAIEVKQSMTFITSLNTTAEQNKFVSDLFNELGSVEFIDEKLIPAATSLCSCGIAFAFRYIRAAMEGGVEMGLYPEKAKHGMIQTLRGAIELLEAHDSHPEQEIDKVTTAGGITIKGLNEMEHAGFTSAVIRGLKASL